MTITESPDCIRVTQRWFSNGASLEHFQQMCSSLERFPILLSSSTFSQIYDIIIDFVSNVKHLFFPIPPCIVPLSRVGHTFIFELKMSKNEEEIIIHFYFLDNTIFFYIKCPFSFSFFHFPYRNWTYRTYYLHNIQKAYAVPANS